MIKVRSEMGLKTLYARALALLSIMIDGQIVDIRVEKFPVSDANSNGTGAGMEARLAILPLFHKNVEIK